MTLVTRLASAFTDTTLPALRKDIVLPTTATTGAGDRMLYDFKNVGTWPSQVAAINVGDELFNLGDTAVVDKVSATFAASYDAATGAVTTASFPLANTGIELENAHDDIFGDTTHNFLFIAWIKPDNSAYRKHTQKGSGDSTSTTKTLDLWTFAGSPRIQLAGSDNRFSTGNDFFYNARIDTVTQVAAAIVKESGSWVGYRYQDGSALGSSFALSAGTNASAIFPLANHNMEIINGPTYRVYVEDLTISNRSHSAVVATDYARGNGRFS